MNQKQQQEDFKMTATTLKGLESVLAGELRTLGAKEIKESIRSVSFRGDPRVSIQSKHRLANSNSDFKTNQNRKNI